MTVADMIRMTVVGDPENYQGESVLHLSELSPDGKRVAVVVRRGNVEQNTVEASILVFRTAELLRSATPDTVVTIASASSRPAVAHVRWLADNATLTFLGAKSERPPQVYRVDVRTHQLRQITSSLTGVRAYDITPTGARVIYTAEAPVDTAARRTRRPGFPVLTTSLVDVMLGTEQSDYARQMTHLFVQDIGGRVARAVPDPVRAERGLGRCEDLFGIHVSPDGRFALRFCYVVMSPAHWQAYTADAYVRRGLADPDSRGVTQYALVDLERGTTAPVLDAPLPAYGRRPAPVWASQRGSVIVGNAYLPLNVADSAERARRTSTLYAIAEIDLASRAVTPVVQEGPVTTALHWDGASQTLLVTPGDSMRRPLPVVGYRARGARWRPESTGTHSLPRANSNGRVTLSLEESLNDPPVLVAHDLRRGSRRVVLELNPHLRAFRLGRVEAITWTARDGRTWRGGLYYPPDYVPTRRYPLVIQTHGFDAEQFSLYGAFTTAFAAQPLATHGMVVLQVPDPPRDVMDTPREAAVAQVGYEGAIDELDRRGIIDRTRVGLIGFSRTCWYVKYFLTHSTYPLAAAALSDGVDAGYFQYIAFGQVIQGHYELLHGVAPFGPGLEVWLREAPGFNLDKVRAPLRIEAIGMESLPQEWEVYAGLKRLGRPVELFVIPDGIHELVRPLERLASQGGNVDWFAFWLLGREDPDPLKAEQYRRWRALRAGRPASL